MPSDFAGGWELQGQPPAQDQMPGLLQMALGGGGGGGDNFDPYGPYGANFPTNWRDQPNTFFSWGDRNQQFLNAERQSYATGGKDPEANAFLANKQRPKMGELEGALLPSTNDWRALPSAYRKPGYALVNGRIIDTALGSDPRRYLESLGVGQDDPGHYKMSQGVGIGVPLSLNDLSIGGQVGVWPGDVRGRESFTHPSYPTT